MVNLTVVRLLVCAILMALGTLEPSHGEPRPAAPVTWLIFVDDLHIDLRDMSLVRKLLTSIATDLIREGDSFAMRSSGPSDVSITVTSNRALLETAIPKVQYGELELIGSGEDETKDEVQYRAEFAGRAADAMVQSLAKRTIARAAMLYISNGDSLIPADPFVAGLPRLAQRSSITVFGLSPRGLRPAPQATPSDGRPRSARDREDTSLNILRAIAEPTGGFAIEAADFADALQRIGRAMR
jgi:hypothetical protein